MKNDDEYELIPHKEILELKKKIEELKRGKEIPTHNQLLSSMDNLTKTIETLLNLFKATAEEMKLEERETEAVSKKFSPLSGKIDTLIDQNKKIAEAIVAVADMVKELKESFEKKPKASKPAPAPRFGEEPGLRPAPPFPGPFPGPAAASRPMPPTPEIPKAAEFGKPIMPPTAGMPPPPRPTPMPPPFEEKKKKGFFGFGK